MQLLDQILLQKLQKPYSNVPPEGGLPILSKTEVMASLSMKFKTLNVEIDKENIKNLVKVNDEQTNMSN